jgi:hypothetical protein
VVPWVNPQAETVEALPPGGEQRFAAHSLRVDPAGGADQGGDTKLGHPAAQLFRAKLAYRPGQWCGQLWVAREEVCQRFGPGEVQAALPGDEHLAGDRRHGLEQIDRHPLAEELFGRHQTRRSATDDYRLIFPGFLGYRCSFHSFPFASRLLCNRVP